MGTRNVHAGHDEQGRGASGACAKIDGVGWFYESVENRPVKDDLIYFLKKEGETVYDCTVAAAGTQSANLSQIIAKCNAHAVDLDISIHFNSAREDLDGDGKTGGVEVWCYDERTKDVAQRICNKVSALGVTNRGVKYSQKLSVLKNTKSKAIIVEICFVDDKDDVMWYRRVGHRNIAKAIAEGVLNKTISDSASPSGGYKYEDGDYNRKAVVTGTGDGFLSVRTGRGTGFEEKGRFLEGQIITVNYCLNNWFSTWDCNGEGYVSGTCIRLL